MNISDLPQEISILREERLKAENRLMGAKDMLASSLILRKVICGNPNCKCQKGKLHRPYPYLSEKIKGKTRLTYRSLKVPIKDIYLYPLLKRFREALGS